MIAPIDMAACPDLAVPHAVMQHVVAVESGRNPFAIGVVGRRLARQPATLAEAVATARMLEREGFNYSLGLAQVNRSNLRKFGLDDYDVAFDPCRNLAAGARILAECRERAGGDWGKAFSCYYSGNFRTGFEHGYVQRVFAAMGRASDPSRSPAAAMPAGTRFEATATPSLDTDAGTRTRAFVPVVRGPAEPPPAATPTPREPAADPKPAVPGASDPAFVF